MSGSMARKAPPRGSRRGRARKQADRAQRDADLGLGVVGGLGLGLAFAFFVAFIDDRGRIPSTSRALWACR